MQGERVPLRVRLTLARDGKANATTAPFEPLPKDAVWTLRIAGTRLDSTDPLIRHKTTRRQVYEAARAEFPREEADEVLRLNERGEVCEGTITNVFIDIGEPVLVTPALTSGLLPGVLRGSLVEQVTAREAVLTESGSARGEGGLCRQFAARADQGEVGLARRALQPFLGHAIARIKRRQASCDATSHPYAL